MEEWQLRMSALLVFPPALSFMFCKMDFHVIL